MVEVRRYEPRSTSDGPIFLSTECMLRVPPSTQLDPTPGATCEDCENKHVAVWARWKALLGKPEVAKGAFKTPAADEPRPGPFGRRRRRVTSQQPIAQTTP